MNTLPRPSTLGVRIRFARENARITQEEIARTIGCSKRQFIRYEQDDTLPSLATLHRIASCLNVSVGWLKPNRRQGAQAGAGGPDGGPRKGKQRRTLASYDLTTLGGRMRFAREEAQLTQGQVSRRIGMSKRTLIRLEQNDALPNLGTIQRFAEVVGKKLDWLIQTGPNVAGADWGSGVPELPRPRPVPEFDQIDRLRRMAWECEKARLAAERSLELSDPGAGCHAQLRAMQSAILKALDALEEELVVASERPRYLLPVPTICWDPPAVASPAGRSASLSSTAASA